MNRKISVGMAVSIVILAMTVTFSITMLVAMRLFDSTVSSVKEKESMYNKIAEVDRYVRSNDYYPIDETTLYDRLTAGYIPVVSTVAQGVDGENAYNINADTAAAEIAIALHAEKLVSMTDIVGLLYDKNDESTLIPEVEVSEIEGYKAAGVIAGGMLPKIEGMADAIYQGVHEAVIIDGRVPHSILLEMFSDRGAGTMFYRRGNR